MDSKERKDAIVKILMDKLDIPQCENCVGFDYCNKNQFKSSCSLIHCEWELSKDVAESIAEEILSKIG